MPSELSWEELRQREQQYMRLLEVRCELLQREVEHLRQQLTQQIAAPQSQERTEIRQLLEASTPEALLQQACSLLQRWACASSAYVFRISPIGSLQVHPPEHTAHARALVEDGIIDWLTAYGNPALLPDLFWTASERSLLAVPLGHSGERFGAIVALDVPTTLPLASLQEQLHYVGTLVGVLLDNMESSRTAEMLHFQLQQLQRELQQAESLATLGKISSLIVHELGNPLQALLSYAELIEAGKGNMQEHARRLRHELLRLHHLLHELRQLLRRPDAPTEFSPIEVATIVEHALQLLQPQFRRDRIRVHLEQEAPTTRILGHAGQLEQVFLNLFLNACDAMPEGGLLHIRLFAEGDTLIVSCRDSGIGIPTELVQQVFEPFFTTKPHGSGLGLSLCQEIVERHGGTITLHSQPGAGTTVVLRFPLRLDVLQQSAPQCA